MVWYVLRIANVYSDNFLLGFTSHTLRFFATKMSLSCWNFVRWCIHCLFLYDAETATIHVQRMMKAFMVNKFILKLTVAKRKKERQRWSKMVNHKTQFTIDFIDDKNLLEFYTHYIMQRRLLLLLLLCVNTSATTIRRALHYYIHCKCVVRIFDQNYIAVKLVSHWK